MSSTTKQLQAKGLRKARHILYIIALMKQVSRFFATRTRASLRRTRLSFPKFVPPFVTMDKRLHGIQWLYQKKIVG